jgi:hypothetical protein
LTRERRQHSATPQGARRPAWPRRLGWFALLWAASVLTVGALAYMLRLWLV